jgi:hypothetical protein
LGGGGGGEGGMTIMRKKTAQEGSSSMAARTRAQSIPRRLLHNLRASFLPWLQQQPASAWGRLLIFPCPCPEALLPQQQQQR